MRAAVEAAEDWGTYVMVHAYHDRSIMRALEAGVKSIDHGAMLENDETFVKMKEVGAIFNPQAFIFSPPEEMVANAPAATYAKGAPLRDGLSRSMELAKKHGVKIVFGVDTFGDAAQLSWQNLEFRHRLPWSPRLRLSCKQRRTPPICSRCPVRAIHTAKAHLV